MGRRWLIVAAVLSLGACASPRPAPPPAPTPKPLPSAEVAFQPAKGQNPAQMDRDKYECYLWAVRKTQFDPTLPGHASTYTVENDPLVVKINNYRRAMKACLIGRGYSVSEDNQ